MESPVKAPHLMKGAALVALITAAGGLFFDSYVINAFAVNLGAIQKTFHTSLAVMGGIASIYLVGYTLGTTLSGILADYLGRRTTLLSSILAYVTTGVATSLATTVSLLAAFRFCTGIASGAEQPIGSTFVVEFSPPAMRNRATAIMNVGWPLGYGLLVLISYLIVPIWTWRAVFLLSVIPAGIVIAIRLRVKEIRPFEVVKQTTQEGRLRRRFTWRHLISHRYRRQVLAHALFWIGNAFTFWSLATFLPLFLSHGGLSRSQVFDFLLLYQVFYIVIPFLIAWCSDRFGRRVVGIGTSVLAIVGVLSLTAGHASPAYLLVTGGVTYALYASPWVIGFAYSSEAFPTEIRGSAIALVMGIGRLVSIVAPLLVGGLAAKIGLGPAIRDMAAAWIVGIVGLLLANETKGTDLRPFAAQDFEPQVPEISQYEPVPNA